VGSTTSTFDAVTGVWQAVGSVADVNALLAGVTFTGALDYDVDFSIATSVSDGTAPAVTGTKLMTAIPVNDAPTATNLSAPETFTEETPLDLTDIVITDVDAGEIVTATLTLSDPNAGALSTATAGSTTSTFDAVTGVWQAVGSVSDVNALLAGVTFTGALDYESDFSIATSVSDGTAPAVTGTKLMTAVPVNDTPVIADQAFGPFAENSPAATVVGAVAASDADAGQTLGYAIVGGNTDGAFAIDPASGEITVANPAAINFEVNPTFGLTVQVSDDGAPVLSASANVTIDLGDVNDAPTLGSASLQVTEATGAGTPVGLMAGADEDAGDSLTYRILGGNTGGAFSIDPASGELSVANASALDFDVNPTFSLTVEVEDVSGATATASVDISLSQLLPTTDPDEGGAGGGDSDSEEETTDPTTDPIVEESVDPVVETMETAPEAETSSLAPEVELGAITMKPSRVPLGDIVEVAPTDPDRNDDDASIVSDDDDDRGPVRQDAREIYRLTVLREQAMWDALSLVGEQISDDAERQQAEVEQTTSRVERVALVLSTGVLAVLARASSLTAMALSSLPVWQRVDPLSVLALSDRERRKREQELQEAELLEDRMASALGDLLETEKEDEDEDEDLDRYDDGPPGA
jgi:hypothetical protein